MIRWDFSDRLANTINIPMITKPMAKVMKCSLENGWKGFAGMFLVRANIYHSDTEEENEDIEENTRNGNTKINSSLCSQFS